MDRDVPLPVGYLRTVSVASVDPPGGAPSGLSPARICSHQCADTLESHAGRRGRAGSSAIHVDTYKSSSDDRGDAELVAVHLASSASKYFWALGASRDSAFALESRSISKHTNSSVAALR